VRFDHAARRLGALAVVGSLVAACAGASTPAPTAAPSSAASPAGTAAASVAPKGELPKPEQTAIKIGFSAATEVSSFAQIQASQLKLFEKYGLTATLLTFEGSAKAVGALQGNQVDIAIADAGSTVSSQLTDVPLVAVGSNATSLTDDLVCQAGIKTAADVKGKKIAISTFGGVSHASALLALKSLNLGPSDAVITQIGGQGARIAALKGGSIDCGIIDKAVSADLVALGMNITTSIWKPPVQPFGRSAIVVTQAYLAKNPNTILAALAASLEGQNMIWTDTTGSSQRWAQWAQIDVAKATPLITDFQSVGNRSLN
jgi:ABC-type nitrate/sulfonate/bicarbonate transport system substrate-binding protein